MNTKSADVVVNGVSAVGTIAEGDLVRSTNDLYKEYGVGRVQKVCGEHAKVEFNPSVFIAPQRAQAEMGATT